MWSGSKTNVQYFVKSIIYLHTEGICANIKREKLCQLITTLILFFSYCGPVSLRTSQITPQAKKKSVLFSRVMIFKDGS